MVALLYPIGATIHIAMTPAPATMVLGYGVGNLGCVLIAAGIWPGTFRIFGLKKRWQLLGAGFLALILGAVLSTRAIMPIHP